MDSSKERKCKLCGWEGKTHLHHIIPRRKNGSECTNNLIELCPNHHAEATEDEELFQIKFNLVGNKKSEEELNELQEYAFLFFNNDFTDQFFNLEKKWGFDNIDAIAYLMGVTRNYILNTYQSNFKANQNI